MSDLSNAGLSPDQLANALELVIEREPVADEDVVAGEPTVGLVPITEVDGIEVGVWELSPGTVTDTEVDEVFVVLFGAATVDFAGDRESLVLRAGSVGRLEDGERTTWTVTETLRKIYIA